VKVKKQIIDKLKSKKGSALLLAMLFSLICLILGIVVLSAGEASNGRIINAAKAEQSYYIASSLFREFQNETTYTYEEGFETFTDDMKLWISTADFDVDTAFSDSTSKHRLTTLRPFVADALFKTMKGHSYSNELRFEMGDQGGIADKYTAVVQMTMEPSDYSIYLDIKDVQKNGESLGAPHLHVIAIQCRRITPTAAVGGEMTAATFEYYQAKFLAVGTTEADG